MSIEGSADQPDDFEERREPVEPTDATADEHADASYDGVHADDTPPNERDDIDDADIDSFIADFEKDEHNRLIEHATTVMLTPYSEGDAYPVLPADEDYAFWATHAEKPELAENIIDDGMRAKTLGEVAKLTDDADTATKAIETARSITDMGSQQDALIAVAVSLKSTEPFDGIEDGRDYLLSEFAGATGDMDVLDQIHDPLFRQFALQQIAERTGNPIAAEMITDPLAKDTAYTSIIQETGDASLLSKISDPDLRDIARASLRDKAEFPGATGWDRVEQEQLANVTPLADIPTIENPQIKVEQCLVHLKHGGYGPDTNAMLAFTALDIIRQANPEPANLQDVYFHRLSRVTNNPDPSYEALQNALTAYRGNTIWRTRVREAVTVIREIERKQNR